MKTYRRDYVEINNALVPLRWMAWESIVEVFISVFIDLLLQNFIGTLNIHMFSIFAELHIFRVGTQQNLTCGPLAWLCGRSSTLPASDHMLSWQRHRYFCLYLYLYLLIWQRQGNFGLYLYLSLTNFQCIVICKHGKIRLFLADINAWVKYSYQYVLYHSFINMVCR